MGKKDDSGGWLDFIFQTNQGKKKGGGGNRDGGNRGGGSNHNSRPPKADNWREKSCPGTGGSYCGNTIKYRTDWDNIPDLCPSCKSKAKSSRQQRPERQERPARDDGWREKSCKCGNTIRYRTNWNRIPDLCPSCIQAEKDKWREKPCKGGCGNTIRYNTDWEHPPNFCASCKEKQKQRHEPNQSENKRFYAACHKAGLTHSEIDRFSEEFHQIPDRERLDFDVIKRMAQDWKSGNGGGFRRSDR